MTGAQEQDENLSDAVSPTNTDHVFEEDDYNEEESEPSVRPPVATAPVTAVESLVAGRARRSTAGNRLATLLHQEADVEDTLFLEDEDDVEFAAEEAEDMSDVQLDSSSEDEDDAGPPAVDAASGEQVDEDLEGERELQRITKEDKAVKKRRAAEAFLKPRVSARKKVTIKDISTSTSTTTPAQNATEVPSSSPRQRKKSERVSWLPEVLAVRASSRTLSLQNRTETMKRLEESEKRRLHTIKLMEAAAAKKDKTNPRKVMTQADRLREAKLTEEMNLKSLNRWEQSEAYRLEEQRKKLAALQNRRLVGPVITFWSGTAEWDEKGKLMRVGKGLVEIVEGGDNEEEGKKGKGKDGKRKSKVRSTTNRGKGKEKSTPEGEADTGQDGQEVRQQDAVIIPHPEKNSNIPSPQPPPSTSPSRPTSSTSDNQNPAHSSDTAPLAPPAPGAASHQQIIKSNGALPMLLEGILEYATLPDPSEHKGPSPEKSTDESTSPTPPPLVEPPRPKTEASTRNLVVLENFDPPAVQTREGVVKVLFPSESKRSWRPRGLAPSNTTVKLATKSSRGTRPPTVRRTTAPKPRGLKAGPQAAPNTSVSASTESDLSMATSFLPFCAHCEQQIVVPNTSILYCSEKCKRKDQAKPPPIPIGPSSPSSGNWSTPPLTPYGDEFSNGPPRKNYVEPLSPTPPRSVPSEEHPEYAGSPPISIVGRTSSDGNYHYNYYRSGTTSPIDSQPSSPTNNSNIYMPPRRPVHLRTLTGGSITSFSGNASNNPPTQYQLHQQRPLPPLHHPVSYSSSPRSIELVTPYLLQDHSQYAGRNYSSHGSSSGSSPSGSSDDLQYEKTLPIAEVAAQVGNLKTLFNFDAIRGRPTASKHGMYTPMDRTPERSPIRGMARGPQPLMMRSGGWVN